MLGSSRVAAQLEASQEGLSSMSEWVSGLRVPTKQIRDFSTFNFSNVSRLSLSTKSLTAANDICKSLDVFEKRNISFEDTFSFA
jgi:hypothetical protein